MPPRLENCLFFIMLTSDKWERPLGQIMDKSSFFTCIGFISTYTGYLLVYLQVLSWVPTPLVGLLIKIYPLGTMTKDTTSESLSHEIVKIWALISQKAWRKGGPHGPHWGTHWPKPDLDTWNTSELCNIHFVWEILKFGRSTWAKT